MATLTVGPGEQFPTLATAIAASQDGDVIKVAAGTYTNDFATITTNITIEGVGGLVNLVATEPLPNGKAILVTDANVTLVNVSFNGAEISQADGGNGAGIRYEGGDLTLDHTYFFDNQDGLLGDPSPGGSITIIDSEFAGNGESSGLTHNLYVGEIGTLTVMDSYFTDPMVGHDIKSRAQTNIIENNRITDPNGTGSYEIDLPNGGDATISGNVIEKGPSAQHTFISFGEEGTLYPSSSLSVTGNIVLNDAESPGPLVRDDIAAAVMISNNQVFGLATADLDAGGTPVESNNTILSSEPALDTSQPFLPVVPVTFPVCFAEGTRILTPRGEIAVEQIRPADFVMTLCDGDLIPERVEWIGYRTIDLTSHPRPELVTPVRITRGAVTADVPRRDLLVSPDHALYFDGVLVLARQLLNGGTIRRDPAFRSVRYFHVELHRHAILLADGMPAESYLDTGNRGFFANSDVPLVLHPGLTSGEIDLRAAGSCVPLHTDEATVRPIWQRLADRAARSGGVAATTEPALRLAIGDRLLRSAHVRGGRHIFVVPRGAAGTRLVSRAADPTECRPWLDDRRMLGVPIGRILLRRAGDVMELPLDHPSLNDGWWEIERVAGMPIRWTNGSALLATLDGPAVLEIHLAGEMVYPLSQPAVMPRRRSTG